MSLFCDNCGYENKDSAKFCKGCGTRIDDEEISKTVETSPQIPPGYGGCPSYSPSQGVNIPHSQQPPDNTPSSYTPTQCVNIQQQPPPPSYHIQQEQTYSAPPYTLDVPAEGNKKIFMFASMSVIVLFLFFAFFRGSIFSSKNSSPTPEPTQVSSGKDHHASLDDPPEVKKPSPVKESEMKIPLKKSLTIKLSCHEPGNEISSSYECVVKVNEVDSSSLKYTWWENYPSGKVQTGDRVMTDMASSRDYNSWWHSGEYKYTKDTSPWMSRKVYRELKGSGKTLFNIDVSGRGDSNLELYLREKTDYSLTYNNQKKSLKALLAYNDRGDKITVLDDGENPLVLSADVAGSYNWYVTSIDSNSNTSSADYSSSDSYEDWLDKGKDCSARGEYSEAVRCYDKAIELAPGNNRTWYNKADTLYKMGDYQGCLDCCNRALDCHEGMNNIDGILNLKQKAQDSLSGSPDGSSSYSYKFWVDKGDEYAGKGDNESAMSCYDRAVELAPENNRTWYGRAKFLYTKGDYQGCINNCDRALKCREGMTNVDDIVILKKKATDGLK